MCLCDLMNCVFTMVLLLLPLWLTGHQAWKIGNNFLNNLCPASIRNLPRAIMISMCTVICVYLVANIAYLGVLSAPQMTQSTAVAVVSVSPNMDCLYDAIVLI